MAFTLNLAHPLVSGHPWNYGCLMWMHNGTASLPPQFYIYNLTPDCRRRGRLQPQDQAPAPIGPQRRAVQLSSRQHRLRVVLCPLPSIVIQNRRPTCTLVPIRCVKASDAANDRAAQSMGERRWRARTELVELCRVGWTVGRWDEVHLVLRRRGCVPRKLSAF